MGKLSLGVFIASYTPLAIALDRQTPAQWPIIAISRSVILFLIWPVETEKIKSPSKGVCAGTIDLEIPSCAATEILFNWDLFKSQSVATIAIVVFFLALSLNNAS